MTPPPPLPLSRPIFFAEIEQLGGAERSALALAHWLYSNNLPCHIVTYSDACQIAGYASHPLPVVELKATGPVRRIAALRRYFRSRPASSPHPLVNGYQPALHATLAGIAGFHTLMHDTPSLFGDAPTRTFQSRLRLALSSRIVSHGLKSGGSTIVTSDYLRAECRKDFGIEARIVRMGGLSVPAGEYRLRPVEKQLRLLSVCRIESNKRIEWILQALADLERSDLPLSSRVDWQLDLAGRGSLIPALTELAVRLGIASRVTFHDFVADSKLQILYAQANLFLMPAVQGYGIPAIESLQRGIPVLLHRESGVSDILLETPWATVLHGDQGSMTAALSASIDNVLRGMHHNVPLPSIPSEESWAAQVADLCGWITPTSA
jgi:glycosyltransferase involved in cell wall biosynthesis